MQNCLPELTVCKLDAILSYYYAKKKDINPAFLKINFLKTKKNQELFEKTVLYFNNHNIDAFEFIEWGISVVWKTHKNKKSNFPQAIFTNELFTKYQKLKKEQDDIKAEHLKLISYFDKSCKYIADICLSTNLSPKNAIKNLISSQNISIAIQTGQISKYWLVTLGLKNLKKISKIIRDPSAKELVEVYIKNFDKVYSDIYDSFLEEKQEEPNPLIGIFQYIG